MKRSIHPFSSSNLNAWVSRWIESIETWSCLERIQIHQKAQHVGMTCFHNSAQLTSYMVWTHVILYIMPGSHVIKRSGLNIARHPLPMQNLFYGQRIIPQGTTFITYSIGNCVINHNVTVANSGSGWSQKEEGEMWKEQQLGEKMRKMKRQSDNEMKTVWCVKTVTRLEWGKNVETWHVDGQMRKNEKISR